MSSSDNPPGAIEASSNDNVGFELDPMDEPAAILYLVFNVILAVAPVTVWYAYINEILEDTHEDNTMYKVSWHILWIGNLVLNGVAGLIGPFSWLFNAFVTIGYIAWVQYLVVWGGSAMQMLNVILLLAGTATYKSSDMSIEGDTTGTVWTEFAVWFVVTGGCYVGIWLLNNNFLAYWAIEEIIHGISPLGSTNLLRIKYGIDQETEDEWAAAHIVGDEDTTTPEDTTGDDTMEADVTVEDDSNADI